MPARIYHYRRPEILLSSPLPFFFVLQCCVAAVTDNGRNIKGNKQQSAEFSHVGLYCMSFLHHWGLCWMQMPWWMTDSVFVSSWSEASKHWHSTKWLSLSARDLLNPSQSPKGRLSKKQKHWPLHALAWSNTLNLSLAFVHWKKSMKLHKMMPPTVCNLCFLLCNLWFLVAMSPWMKRNLTVFEFFMLTLVFFPY